MALKDLATKSGNPAWKGLRNLTAATQSGDAITRSAIAIRTAFLMLACCGGAAIGWIGSQNGLIPAANVTSVLIGTSVGYLVMALVIAFRPMMAQWLATPAVTIQGVGLGLLSVMLDARYHGIATQALLATLVVGGVTWVAYTTKLIRPTARFVSIIQIATVSIALLYGADLLMTWLLPSSPLRALTTGNGMLGIGFSLLMVGLASMNLVVDYLQADQLVEQRAPKALAWYSAWALMVTLIWLYVEMLRLLMKLNSRR